MTKKGSADVQFIRGRQPVLEVFRAGRRHVRQLFLALGTERKGSIGEILEYVEKYDIPIHYIDRAQLDQRGRNHQGVQAEVDAYPYADLGKILSDIRRNEEPGLLLLLDLLQDPQNFGTLLRTAAAVGVHGVVLPPKRAVHVTPAVVSASAGASEHLQIAIDNLAASIEAIKQEDIWVFGLEESPQAELISDVDLNRPVALVVGAEGQGLRRLVREECDLLLRLPMRGGLDSLNAAVAGSIALYNLWEARGWAGARPA